MRSKVEPERGGESTKTARSFFGVPSSRRSRTGKPRRKAQSATAPGNFSRFIQIVTQLDVTWDLYSLTADALLWRLPQAEFGLAYRAAAASQAELPTVLL